MTSIAKAIRSVLLTAEPRTKVMATRKLERDWKQGRLDHRFDVQMPDAPARPREPELLPPNRMPARRKAGSAAARTAMLHAFAQIEFSAIDLALDAAGRFGRGLPRQWIDDWLGVAADESLHFALLDRRLRAIGSRYGALPAHAGLWQAAEATAGDVLARLAIVPMVLEARGLDVSPATIERFEGVGDRASAAILRRIYHDEIRHVRVGSSWFESICAEHKLERAVRWRELVRTHFRGGLKPPFNDSARESAGLPREYYAPIAPSPPLPK